MKKLILIASLFISSFAANATVHTVYVWDGYFQFTPSNISINLGDTIQWLPLGGGAPTMAHSITSTSIPGGAATFNYIWQAPSDTFFQYIPTIAGNYDYVCTPHEISNNMVGRFAVNNGTSVEEKAKKKKNHWVYPNPAQNQLHIDQEHLGKIFKVYSIQGKEMYHGIVTKPVDISHWADGSYLLVLTGDKPLIQKIVKLP